MQKGRRFTGWLVLALLLLTGCWDRKEIEETGIVLGLAFDKQNKQIETLHCFALPKSLSERGGSGTKNFVNLHNEGDLVFDNVRALAKGSVRYPSYEHLKVIVISEELARTTDLRNMLDFLLRNPQARRSTKVILSKGKAEELFKPVTPLEPVSALKLSELADASSLTLEMAPRMILAEMSAKLVSKTSFVVQRGEIVPHAGAQLSGGAVIKGDTGKWVGSLSAKEMAGLHFLLKDNHVKSGIVEVEDPAGKEPPFVYEFRKIRSKMEPRIKDGEISFTVSIETEGKLREDWRTSGSAFDNSFIRHTEERTAERIKEMTEFALAKVQKELQADVAGFGKKLSIHSPQVWKSVKEDWETVFSAIPVEVQVRVSIRDYGNRGTKQPNGAGR